MCGFTRPVNTSKKGRHHYASGFTSNIVVCGFTSLDYKLREYKTDRDSQTDTERQAHISVQTKQRIDCMQIKMRDY